MKFPTLALLLSSALLAFGQTPETPSNKSDPVEDILKAKPVEPQSAPVVPTKARPEVAIDEATIMATSPLPQIRALDEFAEVNWKAVYKTEGLVRDFDSSAFGADNQALPFLLGVRMADAIFAVYLQDKEALKLAADDIRNFAQKLKVESATLDAADDNLKLASNGQWSYVVTNLGMLQMKVIQQLQRVDPNNRRMVILGGWIQGARVSAQAVLTSKPKAGSEFSASYLLRNSIITGLMDMTNKIDGPLGKSPLVLKMQEHLPTVKEILAIPIDAKTINLPTEKISDLLKRATDVVDTGLANLGKVTPAAPEPAKTAPTVTQQTSAPATTPEDTKDTQASTQSTNKKSPKQAPIPAQNNKRIWIVGIALLVTLPMILVYRRNSKPTQKP